MQSMSRQRMSLIYCIPHKEPKEHCRKIECFPRILPGLRKEGRKPNPQRLRGSRHEVDSPAERPFTERGAHLHRHTMIAALPLTKAVVKMCFYARLIVAAVHVTENQREDFPNRRWCATCFAEQGKR